MSVMERRQSHKPVEVRETAEGGKMIVGYASVFNSDSEDLGFIEQVDPGAFTKTLQESDVRALANHEPDWTLGRVKNGTLRLFTDSHGLRYEIDVNPADPDGQRALAKVERGDWDGSSFSFKTIRDEWNWQANPPQRRLLEVGLIDVGPVCFPAYPDASAAARALEPIAARTGHPVEQLVTALRSGEIRSLVEPAESEPAPQPIYRVLAHPVVSRDQLAAAETRELLAEGEPAEDVASAEIVAMAGAVVAAYLAKLAEVGLEPSEDGFSLCPIADQDGDADGDGLTLWCVYDEYAAWYISAEGADATVVGYSEWSMWRSEPPADETASTVAVDLALLEQRARTIRIAALAA